jgi:hypothetical protein
MSPERLDLALSGAGLDDHDAFELFAKYMLKAVAEEIAGTAADTPIYYGNPDGGIDAKARAGARTVGVQAKRYARFEDEVPAIRKSFRTMLKHAPHEDVTDFVWCSVHRPTVKNQETVTDVCAQLEDEAESSGRSVTVTFWSEERMRLRLRELDPQALAVWSGHFEMPLREVLSRAGTCVRRISERIPPTSSRDAIAFHSDLDDFLASLDDSRLLRRELDAVQEAVPRFIRQVQELGTDARVDVAADALAACAAARVRLLERLRDYPSVAQSVLPASDTWPSHRRREQAAAATALFEDLERAISGCEDHLLDACDACTATLKANGDVHDAWLVRELGRQTLVLSKVAAGLRSRLGRILTRLDGERTGVVIVRGGWGTGKSFHLGRYCGARIRQDLPTVLVAARDFDDVPWLDEVARLQGRPGRGHEFLAALHIFALATDRRVVLAIDGINEAPGTNHLARLHEVAEDLVGFPDIMLVVTRRDDVTPRWAADAESAWAVFDHHGVEPGAAWQILRQELPLPPMAGMGMMAGFSPASGLPAWRRPLFLRIFARCLISRGADPSVPVAPPQVGVLLRDWLAVLESEYDAPGSGSGKGRHASPMIGLVVDAIARLCTAGAVALSSVTQHLWKTGGWDPSSTTHAVNFLVDEGVLEYAGDGTRIRFALQRIADHHEARRLLQQPRQLREALDADIEEDLETPGPLTLALAELAVAETKSELPRLYGRRRPPAVDTAFLMALQFRDAELVSSDTKRTATRLLRDPAAAPLVWYAVVANAAIPDHPLGPAWAHATLCRLRPRTRDLRWALPIRDLLEDEHARDDLATAWLWMERALSGESLTDQHVEELALFLLWCTAPPIERLRAASVRVLATALLRSPQLADRVFEVASASRDAFVVEGAWSAVLGAALRSPDQQAKIRLADSAARATAGFRILPAHYRTAELVHRFRRAVPASPSWPDEWRRITSLRALMRVAERGAPSGPRRWYLPSLRRLRRGVLGARDVALFDDDASPLLSEYRTRRLVRRLGYRGRVERGDRSQLALFESDGPYLFDKYAATARQRWLLQQAADHGISKTRVIINGRWQKPSPGEGIDVELGNPLELVMDPSIPLMYAWHSKPDRISHGSWWVPEAIAAFLDMATPVDLPGEGPQSIVAVSDPEGKRWFVLHGELRVKLPADDEASGWTSPLLQPFSGMAYSGPSLEPPAETRREVYVLIQAYLLDAELADAPAELIVDHAADGRDARIHREKDAALLLGDELEAAEPDYAAGLVAAEATVEHTSHVLSHWHDHDAVVPIREIRHRLGLRWTGYARDFYAGDTHVIGDPGHSFAERTACPLLMTEAAALRLLDSGRTLAWSVELSDRLAGMWFGDQPKSEYWHILRTDGSIRSFAGRLRRR